jgi:tetratricopeptide (TPR) repeat protein
LEYDTSAAKFSGAAMRATAVLFSSAWFVAACLSAFAQDNAPRTECDKYAGSNYDPRIKGAGVATEKIDPKIAIPACLDAVSHYPQTSRFRYQLGRTYLSSKDYTRSLDNFHKAAEQGDTFAYAALGWMYQNGVGVTKDLARAVAWFRKAAEQGNAVGQFDLGVMYHNGIGVAKDDAQAVVWFKKSADQGFELAISNLEILKKAEQLQQQVDWCANSTHRFSLDKQINGCTVAIQSRLWSGQGLAWAFNDRGFAQYLKGNFDAAFADFEQSIQLDPKNAVAFNNRGLIYLAEGELDRAIADFDQAIRIDPTYIFAFNNRGSAYSDKEDYDRAIADYREAIRLNPKFAVAFNGRGNAYRRKGEYDRAIADYDQAIKLNPNYALAFYNRNVAKRKTGDKEGAEIDLATARRINPNVGK